MSDEREKLAEEIYKARYPNMSRHSPLEKESEYIKRDHLEVADLILARESKYVEALGDKDQAILLLKEEKLDQQRVMGKQIEDGQRQISELKIQLKDWLDSFNEVVRENFPSDEKHCECVPYLRKRISDLEAHVEGMRETLLANYKKLAACFENELIPINDFNFFISYCVIPKLLSSSTTDLAEKCGRMEKALKQADEMFEHKHYVYQREAHCSICEDITRIIKDAIHPTPKPCGTCKEKREVYHISADSVKPCPDCGEKMKRMEEVILAANQFIKFSMDTRAILEHVRNGGEISTVGLKREEEAFSTLDDTLNKYNALYPTPKPCETRKGTRTVMEHSGDAEWTPIECPDCKPKPCEKCGGKQIIEVDHEGTSWDEPCPDCGPGGKK